ncbi:MAG: T9SS type A sorting domain-containing protein [Chitinophagaceae bacterium]|nr:T9SS type A sorting domain-containing protein [Chitinophagaceae bacterium]
MIKNLLSVLVFLLAVICSVNAQIYNQNTESGTRYHSANNVATGNPKVMLDDINIASATIGANNTLNITQLKFGIRRAGGTTAAACTVVGFVSKVDDTATLFTNVVHLPLTNVGSLAMPAPTASAFTTELATFGDGSATLATVRIDTGKLFTNFGSFFAGLTIAPFASGTPNGIRITTGPEANYNGFWLVDTDSSVVRTGPYTFGGTPPSAANFYVQVFGTFANALPVNFGKFSAMSGRDGSVLLNWETITEINNKGFSVEKSLDGVTFKEMGWVEGTNNNKGSNYTFTDWFPESGVNYYRLKQVDHDGKISYSNVAFAKISLPVQMTVAPNPIKNIGSIKLYLNEESKVDLQLLNSNGQLISVINSGIKNSGWHDIPFNINGSKGTYIIRAVINKNEIVNKLVIKE